MDIIDLIINRTIQNADNNWGMDINHFDWVPGVGLYGFYKAYEATRKTYILDFIMKWTKDHLQEAYQKKTVNSTAPMATIVKLYQHTGDESLLKVCQDIGNFILYEAPRTTKGGLEHTVTEQNTDFGQQIWADTLFMVCIFLAELYSITKDESYRNECVFQLTLHHKMLKDITSGLFFHAYNFQQDNWMSAVRWGRANAWIIVSTFEILSHIQGDFSGKGNVLSSISEQISALEKLQRKNGMFGTVLDHSDSYDEASATAGFAYGILKGIQAGYVDIKYLPMGLRAKEAVKAAFNEKGELQFVSGGTPVKADAQAYKDISICPTLYGQGLGLMALCV